ncbi:MAG: efflux RND transporter periplasmic adaptor subunit [Bacteroidetes bacterium]|nr:efflux RND transporter periplasmic adaptor subunit [Bacteroidota bacterium]
MSRSYSYFFGVLSFVAVVFLTACGGSESAELTMNDSGESAAESASNGPTGSARTIRVSAIEMVPSSFEEILPITGSLSAPQDASLSSQTAGTIVDLVEIGTRVEEGSVIARLDDRIIQAALNQARANLDAVQSQANLMEDMYRRQEPLYQDSIISAIEYENVLAQLNQAKAALAQSEAAVAQAEQQLENTFVKAPFSGIIEERFAEQGEQVMPGMPIARIVNTRRLKVMAGVPETYAADIRKGSSVSVSFRAYGGMTREATVSFVGSVINPQNRTFMIEIDISNDDGLLKPAMIADVQVSRRLLKEQIVLSQTAILRDENGSSVYVIVDTDGQNIAERRQIVLGPSYEGRTVVASGLAAGDRVITSGQTTVAEGDLVEIAN